MTEPHDIAGPSDWVARWAHLAPARTPVLDLACGGGRHAWYFLRNGYPVTAVDRDISRVQGLAIAADRGDFRAIETDLESGGPQAGKGGPLPGNTFGAVVVTNYLHRPLFPGIEAAVAPGGVLIYETFAIGNERFGKPSNPDFLLQPGELLHAFPALTTVAYEHGETALPRPMVVQRLAAVRAANGDTATAALDAPAVAKAGLQA